MKFIWFVKRAVRARNRYLHPGRETTSSFTRGNASRPVKNPKHYVFRRSGGKPVTSTGLSLPGLVVKVPVQNCKTVGRSSLTNTCSIELLHGARWLLRSHGRRWLLGLLISIAWIDLPNIKIIWNITVKHKYMIFFLPIFI